MTKMVCVDYLVVGAGPAGLQTAFFLDRNNRSYLVLEAKDRAGSFFDQFPRHGRLISINKVHTGYSDRESQLRYDWNSLLCDDDSLAFTNYSDQYFASARTYAQYLRDYAERMDLNIRYNCPVKSVSRGEPEGTYYVQTTTGETYHCKRLIIATGLWDPWTPDIPGIELGENYVDFSLEPSDYADQKVLIIGKGNSGFEMANWITSATRVTHVCSPHSVKMAWKTHFFGHLRAVNNDFLDTYILKGQNSVLDAEILSIQKEDGEYVVDIMFTHAEGQRSQFAYDRVLVCTGFKWNHSYFADDCKPESTECGRLPKMTSSWESTNLPNVFFAGTLMQMRDRHKTMSNVLHGFRYNIKCLSAIFGERYENEAWPSERLDRCPTAIAAKIAERVSTNAGLMHQPGFLSDVMLLREDHAEYLETVAVDFARDSRFAQAADCFVITMEYGDTLDDFLSVNREPDPEKAYNDFYLHPRIQHWQYGKKVAEHHMSESLENEWRLDKHPGRKPLIRKMGFHGQDDSSQFQHLHRNKLIDFLEKRLAEGASVVHQAG